MINEKKIMKLALNIGFSSAAFMDVSEMVIIPEYRKFCEMNYCHCYDVVPACPPQCGTVEEMTDRVNRYRRVLVLQTEHPSTFVGDDAGAKAAKREHNQLADQLLEELAREIPGDILRMSAGPWKTNSCMSAYCVDAQKMADAVGMVCWADDGKSRFFSQILFA